MNMEKEKWQGSEAQQQQCREAIFRESDHAIDSLRIVINGHDFLSKKIVTEAEVRVLEAALMILEKLKGE